MSNTTDCSLQGNPDFYGPGIRTGFYLQRISALLITLFIPRKETLPQAINILLQLAIFSGILVLTRSKAATAVEIIIAFWLIFGSLSSLTGNGFTQLGKLVGIARPLL